MNNCVKGSRYNIIKKTCEQCKPGTFTDKDKSLICKPCAPGYFQDGSGMTNCKACEIGTYSTLPGSTKCDVPPPGNFTSKKASALYTICPPGSYCKDGIRNPAPAGSYQTLPGKSDYIQCPIGTYQNKSGSILCLPAGLGNYTDKIGSTSSTKCPKGSYCVLGKRYPAPVGTYVDTEGINIPKICPAGTYTDKEGSTAPIDCQAGTYQDQKGQSTCIPAPAGKYVERTRSTAAKVCTPGTYQPETGKNKCLQVPDGSYSDDGITLKICPPGTYCINGIKYPAPEGTYTDKQGSTNVIDCPIGTYQNQQGQTSCIAAPAGKYVDSIRSIAPKDCPVGTYQPQTGQNSCLQIPDGSYSDDGITIKICPPGSYCVKGIRYPAPQGTFSNAQELTSAIDCRIGTYQDQSGQTSCIQAPAGKYVDSTKSIAVKECPPGTYQPQTGQDKCLQIPDGSYTDDSITLKICSPGTYCLKGIKYPAPEGTYTDKGGLSTPINCPIGTYQNEKGQTICKKPLPGTYTDKEGMITPLDCPIGSFCSNGIINISPPGTYTDKIKMSFPETCPIGSYCINGIKTECVGYEYQDQPGQSTCKRQKEIPVDIANDKFMTKTCPPRYYPNPNDGNTCLLCEKGFKCPAGNRRESCKSPNDRYYQDEEGAISCKECPAGYGCENPANSPVLCTSNPNGNYFIERDHKCVDTGISSKDPGLTLSGGKINPITGLMDGAYRCTTDKWEPKLWAPCIWGFDQLREVNPNPGYCTPKNPNDPNKPATKRPCFGNWWFV